MSENFFSNSIYVLCDIIYYIAMHIFFLCIEKKPKHKCLCLFIYLSCFISGILLYLFSDSLPSYIFTVSTIVFIFVICCNYTSNIARCFLFSSFFSICVAVSELFSGFFVSMLFSFHASQLNDGVFPYSFGLIMCRLLILTFSLILYTFLRNKNTFRRPTMFWIIAILFPIGSIYILYFIYTNAILNQITNYAGILIILFTLFFMNILVFIFYDKICRDSALREENAYLTHYLKLQELQQKNTNDYNAKVSQINHDMKHYVLGIRQLIKDKHYEEALKLLNTKSKELSIRHTVLSSPDPVINNIINYKTTDAQKLGITIEVTASISEDTGLDAGDLSILLCNAIDNAVEYLSSHPQAGKTIPIHIHFDYNVLLFTISNRVLKDIKIPSDLLLPTSKSRDRNLHGIGIKSMKRIVKKYSGTLSIECKNQTFTLTATLFLQDRRDKK